MLVCLPVEVIVIDCFCTDFSIVINTGAQLRKEGRNKITRINGKEGYNAENAKKLDAGQ